MFNIIEIMRVAMSHCNYHLVIDKVAWVYEQSTRGQLGVKPLIPKNVSLEEMVEKI